MGNAIGLFCSSAMHMPQVLSTEACSLELSGLTDSKWGMMLYSRGCRRVRESNAYEEHKVID